MVMKRSSRSDPKLLAFFISSNQSFSVFIMHHVHDIFFTTKNSHPLHVSRQRSTTSNMHASSEKKTTKSSILSICKAPHPVPQDLQSSGVRIRLYLYFRVQGKRLLRFPTFFLSPFHCAIDSFYGSNNFISSQGIRH